MSAERHPTQRELIEGAIRTVEQVLLPELHSVWARNAAGGLLGQLRYALAREANDTLAGQNAELASCLAALLAEFPELREAAAHAEVSGDTGWDLRERAGRLLIHALDDQTAAADAVRARLRPLLLAHVAQDLAETGPMLQAFLTSGSLGSTG